MDCCEEVGIEPTSLVKELFAAKLKRNSYSNSSIVAHYCSLEKINIGQLWHRFGQTLGPRAFQNHLFSQIAASIL